MLRIPARSLLATSLLAAGLTAAAAAGPSDLAVEVHRVPLSDWMAAQGPQLVAFQARETSKPFSALGDVGVVDYAGGVAQASGLAFGFTASGSVSVRGFPDGTGEVLVNLSFTNALTTALRNGAPIFGYSAVSLAGGIGTPGLSNGHLQAKYTVPDAEHPELDLATVVFLGAGEVSQLKFVSSGRGPCRAALGVPDGMPGQCVIANTGLFNTTGGGATADAFPAERVDVHPLGHAALSEASTSGTEFEPVADEVPPALRTATTWGGLKSLYRR